MAADHKVLNEGSESWNNHRYAAVVQDLATQWTQSYPCKTKTSYETEKSLRMFLEPSQVRMEDAQKNYSKFPSQNVRMYGYVFQNINGRSRGNTVRSNCSSWTKILRTPTRRTLVGKTVRKNIDDTWLGKSTKLGMLVLSQKTKIILVGLCGWHQNGRKEAEFSSYVEEIDEKRWLERASIISWSRLLRMHSTGMQTKRENH